MRHGGILSLLRSVPVCVGNLRHISPSRQGSCSELRSVVFQQKQPEPNPHIAIRCAQAIDDGSTADIPYRGFPESGTGHICECDECAERLGISRACMRNSALLSLVLWLVLIGITWGVLKVFG